MSDSVTPTEAKIAPPMPVNLGNIIPAAYKEEEVKFIFRKVTDALGGETRREAVILQVPHITWHGLLRLLDVNEKAQEFVLSLLNNEVDAAVRLQVSDDTKPVNKQEELLLQKISLEYLVNQPKAERVGAGISKEVWDEFALDYVAIMPGLTGRTVEAVTYASKVFLQRLQPAKTNRPALAKLEEYLNLWFSNSANAETLQEVYKFLISKIETFLKVTDEEMLGNL